MQRKSSHNQIEYIEIFKFVKKIFEYCYDDDTIFSIFTNSLNSRLIKENFDHVLYQKHFLDIKKCLNILEKEVLNGNKLTYISQYRNNIFYHQLESVDFLKDVYSFLADKGEIEPYVVYANLKKRELEEKLPRTFKQLFIEEKHTYDYVQPDNIAKYFKNNKLGNIITEIINTIEKNQISTFALKQMSLKTFLINFERCTCHISSNTKTAIWNLFCS